MRDKVNCEDNKRLSLVLLDENGNARKNEKCRKRKFGKTKRNLFWYLLLALLSFITIILFWFTEIYNQMMLQSLVIRDRSEKLNYYLKPTYYSTISVYAFNYTNSKEFLAGTDKKLKIQEIGPYTYREQINRVNVKHDGDRITFQDNTTHTYIPDPSGRLSEDDIITIPYVTLMGSIKTLEQGSFLQKLAFNSLINIYKPNEFHNISIREFIFGYRDSFMDMLAKLESRYVPEDSGILSLKNGLMPFKLTVDTGLNDVENVGKVIAVNEKENMDIWKSDECNKDFGYDGLHCGIKPAKNRKDTGIYMPLCCRSYPMVFKGEAPIYDNVQSLYYIMPNNIYDKPSESNHNKYYCELKSVKEDHINGTIDISDCFTGSPPIIVSFPHFMYGEEKLFEYFEGLSPNSSLHETHAYIHKRFASSLYIASRGQINVKLYSPYKKYFQKFPKGMIFPLAWTEVINVVSDDDKIWLFMSTRVTDFAENFFQYGSIFSFLVFLVLFLKCLQEGLQ